MLWAIELVAFALLAIEIAWIALRGPIDLGPRASEKVFLLALPAWIGILAGLPLIYDSWFDRKKPRTRAMELILRGAFLLGAATFVMMLILFAWKQLIVRS